jgi:RNA polymerase sigma factor (TIGR02999 family)
MRRRVILTPMTEVSRLLTAIDAGDPQAASQLLPLVYSELRRLAAAQLAGEKPGQTLDPTGLVHEAYLRLVVGRDSSKDAGRQFNGRRHFVLAAAEAMRHILVDNARRKLTLKRGGGRARAEFEEEDQAAREAPEEVVAVDDALAGLAAKNPQAAELVKLRYFVGLSISEAASQLDISPRHANRLWVYARAALRRAVDER